MKSGTFTNNTSFSVTAASVNVPTGEITVDGAVDFTVPNGVRVLEVSENYSSYSRYVGVTPNTTHHLVLGLEEKDPGVRMTYCLKCSTHHYKQYIAWASSEYSERAVIRWSPEINNHTPDVTDY